MRKTLLRAMALALVLQGEGWAEVVTDGTVGPRQTVSGPDHVIPVDLGTQMGTNLFHSFQTFDILANESATFTGPGNIEHVITRVTGGTPSTIEGLLKSEVGSAAFYFLNPAGVIFGPKAKVDVPGAFHVSTGDEVRLADGAVFSATQPEGNSLTMARPEAFGFLGANPAGAILLNGASLDFSTGSVLLAGGDVRLEDARISNTTGNMLIAAMGSSTGEVSLDGSLSARPNGSVVVDHSIMSTESSNTEDAGLIAVLGGECLLDDGSIDSTTYAGGRGGDIMIEASGKVRLTDFSLITVGTYGDGSGDTGSVTVKAAEVLVDEGWITSDTFADGQGGNVSIEASGKIRVSDISQISAEARGSGNAGSVALKASDVLLVGGGSISSSTWSAGKGGTVAIEASGRVRVMDDGQISAEAWGSGDAGSVSVQAAEVFVDAGQIISDTYAEGQGGNVALEASGKVRVTDDDGMISAEARGSGDAGSVSIEAAEVLVDGGWISSDTWSAGQGGDVVVDVSGGLRVSDGGITAGAVKGSGDAGTISVQAAEVLVDGGLISSTTSSAGQGGEVVVDVLGDLRVSAGGIAAMAKKGSSGDAGSVSVQAAEVVVDGTGEIRSDTYSAGQGGDIAIKASGKVRITDEGIIFADARGSGDAGSVSVQAAEVVVDGEGWITSDTYGAGQGGDVVVDVSGGLHISGGGISADALEGSGGDAGSVSVQAAEVLVDGGWISSSTWSAGQGGDVVVDVAGGLHVSDGGISASADAGSGDAGSISIKAAEVLVNGGWIDSSTSSAGQGGDVVVDVSAGLRVSAGGIAASADAGSGDAGSISIKAAEVLVDGGSIDSSTWSAGQGGDVVVDVSGGLRVSAGGIAADAVAGSGDAGSVFVQAAEVLIDGGEITAAVSAEAAGDIGDIQVAAQDIHLTNSGQISIANNGTGVSTLSHHLTVIADALVMESGAAIITESTGQAPASDVVLQVGHLLDLTDSRIATTANLGDGGDIRINDPWLLRMKDSLITTSVLGASGNGGDISLAGAFLVMDGGFIQANTTAQGGKGGDITLQVMRLLPMGGEVAIGGSEQLNFAPGRNVIQAAAPTGVSGTIVITAPDLGVGGGLLALDSRYLDTSRLYEGACARAGSGSSLLLGGLGGLPPSLDEALVSPLHLGRMERLLDGEPSPRPSPNRGANE